MSMIAKVFFIWYNFNNMFIIEFIKTLQRENEFTVKLRVNETMSICSKDIKTWILNNQEMIKHNKAWYVLKNLSIREKLLKLHHNNFLTKHINIDKISKLSNCKYYWKSMILNVKKYINICNICQRVKIKCHLLYDALRSLFQLINSCLKITINVITNLLFNK